MAVYSYTPTEGAYGHGIATIDNEKGIQTFEYTELGEYNGKQYILSVDGKYISTVAADQTALCLVDEATAKESPLALWTATVSSGYVKLTNQAGQSLTYYASGATRYFTTATNSSANQNLTQTKNGGGIYLAAKAVGGNKNSLYINKLEC